MNTFMIALLWRKIHGNDMTVTNQIARRITGEAKTGNVDETRFI